MESKSQEAENRVATPRTPTFLWTPEIGAQLLGAYTGISDDEVARLRRLLTEAHREIEVAAAEATAPAGESQSSPNKEKAA